MIDLTATEQLAELNAGRINSVELTRFYLDRIQAHDPRLQTFLRVDRDGALERAAHIDRRRRAGDRVGGLGGLPIAVKDVLCTRDQVTSCASRMLEHFRPPYDATVVKRLHEADAVVVGKTNMDEFAMGSSTENSAFHPTRNPWDPTRTPGGSSGGAAACVAASLVPLSVGSDTGGSIRQPASHCGVVGLKPTYGLVSRYGLVAFASSLDQVGPLARTVEDAALLLDIIAGHDPHDATSIPTQTPRFRESVGQPLKGLRLGIADEHLSAGLDAEVEKAVQEAVRVFSSLGARVERVSLPHSKYSVATYYIIAPSEASSNLARYDGVHYGYRTDSQNPATDGETNLVQMYRQTRAEGFGAEVKRRIMLGTYALSAGYYDAYYLKALKVRRLIRRDFDEAFANVDILVGPVSPQPAFPLGTMTDDPLALYLMDLFTVSANLAGIPGLSVPCGFTSGGLPIGLQLQAPPLYEEKLLRAGYMFQQATDWHQRRPPLD